MKTIILLTRSRALLWNFYRTNSLDFRRSADIWVGDESPQEVLTCIGFDPPATQLIASGWLELLEEEEELMLNVLRCHLTY